ncbi:MAG: undecaprenyl-phosphate glucose phosphotransferase [Bacteroidales bacterium]|nr:undecaprenyl-phosphate glucose phosphotransferase [Bacteroidales bacterium]
MNDSDKVFREQKGFGFLIDWLIAAGEVFILAILFLCILNLLDPLYTWPFTTRIRESLFLLGISYVCSLYFYPINVSKHIVYFDAILKQLFFSTFIMMVFFVMSLIFFDYQEISTLLLTVSFVVFYLGLAIWRVFVRSMLKLYRRKGRNFKNVIIIGAGKNGLRLYDALMNDLSYGYRVLGFFDDNLALKNELSNYLGMTHEVEEYAEKNSVDHIYCTLPGSQDEKTLRIMNFAEKHAIHFFWVPEVARSLRRGMKLELIAMMPVLSMRSEPLLYGYNRLIKRLFDIVFSLSFLIFLFPIIYIILAIAIKLSSPGPVFFKQMRTGLYGKEFYCYKFRSMRVNSEADSLQAQEDDPRKTKLGDFLRRTNLDELPQFWNVLVGDMSVVGPRPHMLKHTDLYSAIIDKYMVRHLVKPGITGWAQVNGYRGETRTVERMEKRVECDVWYIENWSFILDVKIIFVTVLNMFRGEHNAY